MVPPTARSPLTASAASADASAERDAADRADPADLADRAEGARGRAVADPATRGGTRRREPLDATHLDAAWSVEHLRRAEAHLARRRQTRCGPSETDRAAMRFLLEQGDAGVEVTPTALAAHLGFSTASITALTDRLVSGSLVSMRPNPADRRSKIIVPVSRDDDPGEVDPLTARIRDLAAELTSEEARLISTFLDRVVQAVDAECPD